MQQREVPPVAGRVQRGRGFRDVLADDGGIADLLVAVAQLVVGQPDGFRIVGLFGVTQRSAEQRDRTRLLAFGERDAAMNAPQRREKCWGTSDGIRGLHDVVALEPRFGERAAQTDFVFVFEARRFQRLREHRNRVGVTPALQGSARASAG